MRVEVDRQACGFTQRLEQHLGGSRLQKAGHILHGDDMRAGLFELSGKCRVVLQVILRTRRIQEIARVADHRLAELVLFDDRIHRHPHVVDPVQAVEDAEEIDPALGCLTNKVLHHVVGVVLVADAVRAAQQHLQEQVRRTFAHQLETLPRIFRQEAHGYVEGRTTPALKREEVRQSPRIGVGDLCDIVGTNARGQQRLVTVAHRRIGHEDTLLVAHPVAELLRTELVEELLRTRLDVGIDIGNDRLGGIGRRLRAALHFRMSVDRHIGEIGQQLGRTVLTLHLLEKLRRRVDEAGRVGIVPEARVADDRFEEGEVRCHATNTELAQRAVHAADRLLRRAARRRHLNQQRIVVAGNDRTRIGGTAVEADAEASRRTIGGDATIVRNEVLLRVFRGDAALQRMTIEADISLLRDTRFGRADRVTVEDVDLSLHDIDAGHDFRDGVLDLDARIDLDEVEFAGVGIHQIFDGSGTDIVGRLGDPERIIGQLLALRFVQVRCWRALDDLLVSALDRAVALEEMNHIAMRITENLAFDVTGALDKLLEVDFVLAERSHCLALAFRHLAQQVLGIANGAHAATATAPGGLEHDRIADLCRQAMDFTFVIRQRIGGRHDRNADADRKIAGGNLVAKLPHSIALRTDEDETCIVAGVHEFGTFRQETVARMDSIRAGQLGDADDFLDRQIAFDRSEIPRQMRATTNLITFVRLEAVQREFVLFGPDGDRFQTELVGGAKDADRDFRTVGDKDLGYWQFDLPKTICQGIVHLRRKVIARCFRKFNLPWTARGRFNLCLCHQTEAKRQGNHMLAIFCI